MVPEPCLEKLWRILQCRDQSLCRAHKLIGQQASQLSEKEQKIRSMAHALNEKEDEIRQLASVAGERLELINRQCVELEAIRRSREYRLGYVALNPWQILKKRVFGNISFP